jgi:hypothetical protein
VGRRFATAAGVALLCGVLTPASPASAPASNPVVRENAIPGTSDWRRAVGGDIQVYGTQIGALPGDAVDQHVQQFMRNALDDLTRPAAPLDMTLSQSAAGVTVTVAPGSDPRARGFVARVRSGTAWLPLCRGVTTCTGRPRTASGPVVVGAVELDDWNRRSAAAYATATFAKKGPDPLRVRPSMRLRLARSPPSAPSPPRTARRSRSSGRSCPQCADVADRPPARSRAWSPRSPRG